MLGRRTTLSVLITSQPQKAGSPRIGISTSPFNLWGIRLAQYHLKGFSKSLKGFAAKLACEPQGFLHEFLPFPH